MNDSLIATPDAGLRILKNQAGPDRQWFRESCLINVREDTAPLARQALRRSHGAYPSSPLRDIVALRVGTALARPSLGGTRSLAHF
jgi:hypothetical protein